MREGSHISQSTNSFYGCKILPRVSLIHVTFLLMTAIRHSSADTQAKGHMPHYPLYEFTIWEYDAHPLSQQKLEKLNGVCPVFAVNLLDSFPSCTERAEHSGIKDAQLRIQWGSDSSLNNRDSICEKHHWKINKYIKKKKKVTVSRATGCAVSITWHFKDEAGQRNLIIAWQIQSGAQLSKVSYSPVIGCNSSILCSWNCYLSKVCMVFGVIYCVYCYFIFNKYIHNIHAWKIWTWNINASED